MKQLTPEETIRMDELHLLVRKETDPDKQLVHLNEIATLMGYPPFKKRTPWSNQLLQFICSGTDHESSSAGRCMKPV